MSVAILLPLKRGRWAICCAAVLALEPVGALAQLTAPPSATRARAAATTLLTQPGPGAIVIPRDNCGTHWTEWGSDPEADSNPCPPACERGERQVLSSRKAGDQDQYQARYQCYLPEIFVDQPAGVVLPVAGAAARPNCGTAWTSAQSDLSTKANPCPTKCDRGELQLVRRSLSSDGGARYEMRYQCYQAETATRSLSASVAERAPKQPFRTVTVPSMSLVGTGLPASVTVAQMTLTGTGLPASVVIGEMSLVGSGLPGAVTVPAMSLVGSGPPTSVTVPVMRLIGSDQPLLLRGRP